MVKKPAGNSQSFWYCHHPHHDLNEIDVDKKYQNKEDPIEKRRRHHFDSKRIGGKSASNKHRDLPKIPNSLQDHRSF